MPNRSFHIVTVANDLDQYRAMKEAFVAAGFEDTVARYTLYDNSIANTADPYDALRRLRADQEEAFTILCHQDVRPDLGDGVAKLLAVLEDLTRKRPDWALAGNAGMGANGFPVFHLNEPDRVFRAKRLPRLVWTLDENFLVIRRDAGRLASEGLSGFHFYGADACLCAAERGRGAYVVDFLLTHLSGGNRFSQAFLDGEVALLNHWRPRLTVGVINTTCASLFLSRWPWLDMQLQKRTVSRVLRRLRLGRIFAKQRPA